MILSVANNSGLTFKLFGPPLRAWFWLRIRARLLVGPQMSSKNLGFSACERTGHHEIESRRACPELVERGRLNLAQDAVLGLEFLHFQSQGVGRRTLGTLFCSRLQA